MTLKKIAAGYWQSDYAFVLPFAVYFIFLHYGGRALIGLAVPGGYYLEFVDKYLDFLSGLRNFYLHALTTILNGIGMKSYIFSHSVKVINGTSLRLEYCCLGVGVINFWLAIVFAYPQKMSLKFKYFFLATFGFVFLNLLRFIVLAIVYSKTMGTPYRHIDYHFIFNCLVYFVQFIFLYKWLQHPVLKSDGSMA